MAIPIDTGTKSEIRGQIWQFGGFYNILNTPNSSLDVLAGFRYFKVKASLDWQVGQPVILLVLGIKYRTKIFSMASLAFKADTDLATVNGLFRTIWILVPVRHR